MSVCPHVPLAMFKHPLHSSVACVIRMLRFSPNTVVQTRAHTSAKAAKSYQFVMLMENIWIFLF